jgi:hypothetical protein
MFLFATFWKVSLSRQWEISGNCKDVVGIIIQTYEKNTFTIRILK